MSETFPMPIDFEPIREVWNKYRLEDDIIIKNKISLGRIIAVSKTTDTQFNYDMKLNTVTELDFPPGKYNWKEGSPKYVEIKVPDDLEKEVKFSILSNKVQVYETVNSSILSFIFIAADMKKIWLTKKTDNLNRPVYHVEVFANISIFNPVKSPTKV